MENVMANMIENVMANMMKQSNEITSKPCPEFIDEKV